MAESPQRLAEATKARYPEIEWYKIAGLRNVLAHDYLGIDIERVWIIVEEFIPSLKSIIQKMMADL